MPAIDILKEQEVLDTPLLLFRCTLTDGTVLRWSTHRVEVAGEQYEGRILRHNVMDVFGSLEAGTESRGDISLVLSNVDAELTALEQSVGFKGSSCQVRFVFYDLAAKQPSTDATVVFAGRGEAPDSIDTQEFAITFRNRFNLQKQVMPRMRVQPRCPWWFPSTDTQRKEAVGGGTERCYSPFYGCGYSAGEPGGRGNLLAGQPFTSCGYTQNDCDARGMFDKDDQGRETRRFAGFQSVPATISVRTHGSSSWHYSDVLDNRARYNDAVPLLYGTAWYEPPVTFTRNDGNLTHIDVLLGAGPIDEVIRVVVDGWEVPIAVANTDMTGTGWFSLVSRGERNGVFNGDLTYAGGNASGDPHGGLAVLSVVVPNRISDGTSLPKVKVFARGLRMERFSGDGQLLDSVFSNNPAWVLLDLLRRSGWKASEIDLGSFGVEASRCEELLEVQDGTGRTLARPRFGVNLCLMKRRPLAEILRGVRTGAGLYFCYDGAGRLMLRSERSLELQQPHKPLGSNGTEPLNGGWPAYEFGDGTNGTSGILRSGNGASTLRTWRRRTSETVNRYSVEFQDEFNEYQQDSVTMTHLDDALRSGAEVAAMLPALGLPNSEQATRAARFWLRKQVDGNFFVAFETSVRAVLLRPGDLISLTSLREGFDRAAFRVLAVRPTLNFETAQILAQKHDDAWYGEFESAAEINPVLRATALQETGVPRPLAGVVPMAGGSPDFEVMEVAVSGASGEWVELDVRFKPPRTTLASKVAPPRVNVSPQIETAGGTLAAGRTYYYALSAVDGDGNETALSFIVRAELPAGDDTCQVRLTDIGFSPGSTGYRVYRGMTPAQLLRVADGQGLVTEFVDSGLAATTDPPPDPRYHHANFYWRWEVLPETQATLFGASEIGNDSLGFLPNELRDARVRISRGTGAGQEAGIASNTPTDITIAGAWRVVPDSSSRFTVADNTWQFGGTTTGDTAKMLVPNRPGRTVQILGRAANAADAETPDGVSPLTRWQIVGEGSAGDAGAPPLPQFAVQPGARGTIEIAGIGFETFDNTRSVNAATTTLHYWNEMNAPTASVLIEGIDEQSEMIKLTNAAQLQVNDTFQVGKEVLRVEEVLDEGIRFRVMRGYADSFVEAHLSGVPAYALSRRTVIIPFAKGFFGSPASGSFAYSISLPDARVALVEMFATNAFGDSPTRRMSLTQTLDEGWRVLSGGQFSFQIEGEVAITANATPPLLTEEPHAVRDVLATIREAPTGGNLELRLLVNDSAYCDLTIPEGVTATDPITCFGKEALPARAVLGLEVRGVPQGTGQSPGRDLTVTMRL